MARKRSATQQFQDQIRRKELDEIIAMFDALTACYQGLPDKSIVDEDRTKLDGFDYNDPEEYEFLQLSQLHPGGYNSHMPRLRGYRLMVSRWRGCKDPKNLTKEDLIRITTF